MAGAFLTAVLSVMSVRAAPALSSVGTLTCTTSENARTAIDANLSCHFAALVGASHEYSGLIARRGAADLPKGKRVLVWAVLAPKSSVERGILEGEYRGKTGGEADARFQLHGGKDGRVVLDPVAPAPLGGDNPVPSVLELRIESTKA